MSIVVSRMPAQRGCQFRLLNMKILQGCDAQVRGERAGWRCLRGWAYWSRPSMDLPAEKRKRLAIGKGTITLICGVAVAAFATYAFVGMYGIDAAQ